MGPSESLSANADLKAEYAAAILEWEASTDAVAWDHTAEDGLTESD